MRIIDIIKPVIADGAGISSRSLDGKDTDTARRPQEPVLLLDSGNRPMDVAEVPGTGRIR